MRFVQYKRKNDDCRYLGVSSDDGSQIKELNKFGCYPNDLKQFIEMGVDVNELKAKVESLESIPTSDVELLSPIIEPQKILCVGLNYRGHCDEQKKEYPKEPMFFSKVKFKVILLSNNYDFIFAVRINNCRPNR